MKTQFTDGTVFVPFKSMISKKGNPWGRVVIKGDRLMKYKASVFGKLVDQAEKDLKQLETPVVLEYRDAEREDEFTTACIAVNFTLRGDKQNWKDKEIMRAGSKKAYAEEKKQAREARSNGGFVEVEDETGKYWTKRSFAIQLDGKWYTKMDFAGEVLGHHQVTTMLKKERINPLNLEGNLAGAIEQVTSLAIQQAEGEGRKVVKGIDIDRMVNSETE